MPKFIVESVAEGTVTLRVPNANYRNTFKLAGNITLSPGQRVSGTIHAQAWKAEAVALGGNYVEPLLGRPRRMQGTVLAVNEAANELTLHVGYDVVVKLPERYKAGNYAIGSRVGFDNLEIPTFTPATVAAPVATAPTAEMRA